MSGSGDGRRLRPWHAFARAALDVARHRGFGLLAVSSAVWGSFLVVSLVLTQVVVDGPALMAILSDLVPVVFRVLDDEVGAVGLLGDVVDRLGSGAWLRLGWWGLLVGGVLWMAAYMLAVAVATASCVRLAWGWVARGERVPVSRALRHGLVRAPHAAAALTAWVAALWLAGTLLIGLPTAWLGTHDQMRVLVVTLPAGIAGFVLVFLWLASRWALASQAASLSERGWHALHTAAAVSGGARGGVLGRWLVTGLCLAIVIGMITAPLTALLGRLPADVLALVGIVAIRVSLSASQGVLAAAASTSMYVDLDGDAAAASP